jgi:23S rRNA-/tRNA-specific pseudouridylate synthase
MWLMKTINKNRILFEDEHLLAVNKLSRELVVRGKGALGKLPLLDFLRQSYELSLKPIHRLDFETSGVVLDLKDKVAGFAEKLVTKELVATNGDFDNIHIKNELCIGATCLTETQVQALLNQTGQQAAVAATQVQSTAAPESTSTPETETASTTPATDSAGSPQASESVEQENSASTTESQPSADAEALSTEGATKSSTTQTPDNN